MTIGLYIYITKDKNIWLKLDITECFQHKQSEGMRYKELIDVINIGT